jgi:hypothetical protein
MPKTMDIDIPQEAPFVQATLQHSHVRMSVTPNDDAQYAYDLAVPKTWAYASAVGPVGSGPFAERSIGVFASGADPGSPVIAVTVMTSPFEIPIDAWLRAKLTHEGWDVVSAFWFPGASGLYFDITVTRVVDDKAEVRRTTVRARGNDVFSVNCMCGLEHWNAAKENFWVAHATFELAAPGAETMEPWFEFAVNKQPNFVVSHPGSWASEPVTAAPNGVSALDVRLVDAKAEELLGYLQVKGESLERGTPSPALEQRKADALMHMRRSGIAPDESTLRELTQALDPRSLAVEGWVGGYTLAGQIGESEIELRLGFVERDGASLTLMTLCPPLAKNLLVSLRTLRVFEIARATLSLKSAFASTADR